MAKRLPPKSVKPKIITNSAAGAKVASVQSISSVLKQQNDALNVIQQNASVSGPADVGAGSADQVQVVGKLDQIFKAIHDHTEVSKKLLSTETREVDKMGRQEKLQQKMLNTTNHLEKAVATGLAKSVHAIGQGLKGAKDLAVGLKEKAGGAIQKMTGKDYKSASEEKFAASNPNKNKPDAMKMAHQNLTVSAPTQPIPTAPAATGYVPQSPASSQGGATGASAQDLANKMGGNTAIKSAALTQTPSDKGKIAQSTTDVLAEKQVTDEQAAEKVRVEKKKVGLLQQIASNTQAMSGRRGSAAGGAEDTAGATQANEGRAGMMGAGLGMGMKAGGALGKGIGGLASGLGSLGKVLGSGVLGGLKLLGGAFSFLANPTLLLGLGAFSAAVWAISKAIDWIGPVFRAFMPAIESFITVFKDGFIKTFEMIPAALSAAGKFIMEIGGGLVKTVKTIAGGVTSMFQAVTGWFTKDKAQTSQDAKNQGKAVGAAIVSAAAGSGGGDKKQTDSQNDLLEQQAGVKYDANGNMTVVDKKKYEGYIRARGGKMPEGGIAGSGKWTSAAVPTSAKRAQEGSVLDNATKEIRETKRKREEAMAKKAGGGGVVVNAPSQTTNTTKTVTYTTIRNTESSVSQYMNSRYALS